MKISGVYTITNQVNGKIYVGHALDIEYRWKIHKKDLANKIHHNSYLQLAWDKYGPDNFLFEILEECEEQFLYTQEHWWCNMLNVHNNIYGYNIMPTNPYARARHSAETKRRISEGNKGKTKGISRPKSEEESIKWNQRIRMPKSLEHNKKVSEAKKGKKREKFSKEWIENLKNNKPRYNLYELDGKMICNNILASNIANITGVSNQSINEAVHKRYIIKKRFIVIKADQDQEKIMQEYKNKDHRGVKLNQVVHHPGQKTNGTDRS